MTTATETRTQVPIYATHVAMEQARQLGIRCIELEVSKRQNRSIARTRDGEPERNGYRWVHTSTFSALLAPTNGRLNPEREAWLITEVRRP